ncbi:MAG TPA: glycosyltransferase family 2 protein [Caulobacteraceae bacterium]|nr:glycosyltransferase family 2 protein [Caulobacteraceae bacterium]
MGDDNLTLSVVKPVAAAPSGPAVFGIVRDENYFLPFFFDHYRALGAELFLIYDDRSGPATVDYLMQQADCVVLRSDSAFGDSFSQGDRGEPRNLPQVLKERVCETFLPGRWALTVDADEFLVLPSGCASLPEFIGALEQAGQLFATAPMVDFYGETLERRNYPHNVDPFSGSPYFDAGPYYYWTGLIWPFRLSGGIRFRLLKMLCERHIDRIGAIFGVESLPPLSKSWKVPLLKHGCGIVRKGDHEVSAAPRASDLSAALAHFKFYPDLDAKIDNALREKQYYGGSTEYAFLKAAIELFGQESLLGPEARRFEGPQSLEQAGLLGPARSGAAANTLLPAGEGGV